MKRRRLAERRKALGMSQEQLAELMGVDPSTVGRWERAETDPQPWHRPRLARALQVSVDELAALLAALDPMLTHDKTADRRPGQQLALLQGIAAVANASGLLVGHLPAGSRRLGINDVARLDAVIALYQSVDREYGGGALCDDVAAFAESASSLLQQSYADSLAPSLHRSVASARKVAGWTAFDAGRHLDAQRHFQSAERAAVAAGDQLLAAQVRYCQARQLQHLRHNQDALGALHQGQRQLGTTSTPAVSAMLCGAEAASLAALGDRQGALAALGNATEAFDQINPEREPAWMRFYDQGELLAQ